MSHKKQFQSHTSRNQRCEDSESINCCQLDVHKALIREKKAAKYDLSQPDIVRKRSCTDVIWIFVFLAVVIAWIVIAIILLKDGGPRKLLAPTDSNNRRCGFDKGVEDRPYLFFFDITKCLPPRRNFLHYDTKQVCVSECPKTNFSSSHYLENRISLKIIKKELICVDEFDKDSLINDYNDVQNAVENEYCAHWYMESEPTARLCLPLYLSNPVHYDAFAVVDLPDGARVQIKDVTNRLIRSGKYVVQRSEGFIIKVGEDLVETWPWIVAFICLGVFVSFICIILLQWITGIMVWTSVIAVIALLVFSSFYTWKKYLEVKNHQEDLSNPNNVKYFEFSPEFTLFMDDLMEHEYTWLALFILFVVCLVVILLLLLFLRNRLNLAIQLIKEGSKAVSSAWSSLIFPPFPWALQLLILAQGVLVFCSLTGQKMSVSRVEGMNGSNCICDNKYKDGDICHVDSFKKECHDAFGNQCLTAKCISSENETESYTIYLHLFNLLMIFWCEYFISGFSQMSLAMAFASYYWTRFKKKLPSCIMLRSVLNVMKYHLGTVALGSLLLALFSWIRVLFEFFYRYINKNNNFIIRCIACCCGCFLACLNKVLRILTKNAYIMCAMKGTNYCTSAKHAFDLIVRNIIRASVLNGVISFLFFLMKVFIIIAMGIMAYFFFSKPIPSLKGLEAEDYQIEYYFFPITIICLVTFFASSLFFGVYSTAVDTIFLCALEDLEMNDGSLEKPYVMNKSLLRIFKVKNKQPI